MVQGLMEMNMHNVVVVGPHIRKGIAALLHGIA